MGTSRIVTAAVTIIMFNSIVISSSSSSIIFAVCTATPLHLLCALLYVLCRMQVCSSVQAARSLRAPLQDHPKSGCKSNGATSSRCVACVVVTSTLGQVQTLAPATDMHTCLVYSAGCGAVRGVLGPLMVQLPTAAIAPRACNINNSRPPENLALQPAP
jgi:hypothetical protein